jgi:hypothetical protein
VGTLVRGTGAHAEGLGTKATGDFSHAEGCFTLAGGKYSHASGVCTTASNIAQTVVGISNAPTDALFIVGNGTFDGDQPVTKSNALEVLKNGDLNVAGVIKSGGKTILTEDTIKNVAKTLAVTSTYAALDWGNTTHIGSVAGQPIYVRLPEKPSSTTSGQSSTIYQYETGRNDNDYSLLLGRSDSTSGYGNVYKYYTAFKANPYTGQLKAVSFYATSDARLKENIKEFKPSKSILDLPVVEFDFKGSGDHQIGCLAQDLQEICPELVSTGNDGYLSINESKLVYLLLLEVKKLKEEVNELRGR